MPPHTFFNYKFYLFLYSLHYATTMRAVTGVPKNPDFSHIAATATLKRIRHSLLPPSNFLP